MKLSKFCNKISLILQALWCAVLYFLIEALCRHSVVEAWDYMTGKPLVFAYNTMFIFTTMLIVYLFHRRCFWRVVVSVFWLFLGIVNCILLMNRVGLCGDLKFGRTVHSLINALLRYDNVKFVLISPNELKVPEYIIENIQKAGAEYKEVTKLEDVIGELDILYMTRVQRERFFNEEDYIRLKDSFILDKKKMSMAKDDMLVLHPLPRVNEISVEVDKDPRAVYFKQVQYGVYVRMALILKLLEVEV